MVRSFLVFLILVDIIVFLFNLFFKNKYLHRNCSLVMTNIVHLLRDFIFQRNHYLDPKYPYYFNVPSLSSYFKMFPEILLGNILKYDTVGNIYKLLGKCSFKYVDEHFPNNL